MSSSSFSYDDLVEALEAANHASDAGHEAGLTTHELARKIGCNETTVRKRLRLLWERGRLKAVSIKIKSINGSFAMSTRYSLLPKNRRTQKRRV